MAIVTDKKLIERLDKARAEKARARKTQQPSAPTGAGAVTDPALIARLDSLRAKQVSQKQEDIEESEVSVVPEGSAFGDFFRTVGAVAAGAFGESVSGLAGLGTLAATGGDVDKAAQAVESTSEFLSYSPETAGSQAMLRRHGRSLSAHCRRF